MNILWTGARGTAVKVLQSKLKELCYDPGIIDGIFGPSTAAAVTALQKDRKLFVDGIAGPQTLNALNLPTISPAAPRSDRTRSL